MQLIKVGYIFAVIRSGCNGAGMVHIILSEIRKMTNLVFSAYVLQGHTWGALKLLPGNRGSGINARCLYESVSVPTAFYGADTCGMKMAGRRKVNLLDASN